jgi:hypothetical protein
MGWFGKREARAEETIASYVFPKTIDTALDPPPSEKELPLLYRGLREWFICCAYRHRHHLWLPSRAVETAWARFIADRDAYADFCRRAFRGQSPDRVELDADGHAMFWTVEAWDRSEASKRGDSVLWSVDEQLGVEAPLGINAEALEQIRSTDDPRYGGPFAYFPGPNY